MRKIRTAVFHYTAPPVVGGVEAVIHAHARTFLNAGYPVSVVAGRGDQAGLPPGTDFFHIPEMDSRHPIITVANQELEQGRVPDNFEDLKELLATAMLPIIEQTDKVIVHNLFTKHFNLPLTAALYHLMDEGVIQRCIAWCHDFTWTSPSSRSKVFPGYPWDLLRTFRTDVNYVVVSEARQDELARLLNCQAEEIRVIYNGVEPEVLLGLSEQGQDLINRLDLLACDLILLMPVRVTKAKNIELAMHVVAALKNRKIQPKLILTGPPDPHDAQSMKYFAHLRALRSELNVEREMRFVFESGPDPEQPFTIDPPAVGDLFRVSDLMFMPSHREGFGMPVLEAGLAGVKVASTGIPAAREIGGEDIILFSADDDPEQIAGRIIEWAEYSATYRLRRRVRQNFTWEAIFQREIEPLLKLR